MHTLPRLAALLLATVLLLTALILPVSAQEPAWEIVDDAGLLTAEQLSELSAHARELTAQYQTDFVIVTVNSLGGKTPKAYANDYYDEKNCGFGPNRDGMLMLLAMESRDYYFLTNGAPTEKLAQAGGIAALENKVVSHLSNGNYYLAFGMFLDTAAAIIDDPTSIPGASYNDDFVYLGFDDEVSYTLADRMQRVAVFAVIGLVIGLIVTAVMKRGMKTARPQRLAADYVRPGSFKLTRKMDLYLYRTRTRVRVQSSNSSSGGRSGGGGGSRGGGGGKF
jgi:uncharacterized protein